MEWKDNNFGVFVYLTLNKLPIVKSIELQTNTYAFEQRVEKERVENESRCAVSIRIHCGEWVNYVHLRLSQVVCVCMLSVMNDVSSCFLNPLINWIVCYTAEILKIPQHQHNMYRRTENASLSHIIHTATFYQMLFIQPDESCNWFCIYSAARDWHLSAWHYFSAASQQNSVSRQKKWR